MKKVLALILCILLACTLFTGCLPKDDGTSNGDPNNNADSIDNMPADLTVKVGETQKLTLDENEDGYVWKIYLPEDASSVLVLEGQQHLNMDGGLREFVLKGIGEGYVTITCEYYDESEGYALSTQAFTIRVEK